MNGTSAGGDDDWIDGSVMISLRNLNDRGRGGQDDCLYVSGIISLEPSTVEEGEKMIVVMFQ